MPALCTAFMHVRTVWEVISKFTRSPFEQPTVQLTCGPIYSFQVELYNIQKNYVRKRRAQHANSKSFEMSYRFIFNFQTKKNNFIYFHFTSCYCWFQLCIKARGSTQVAQMRFQAGGYERVTRALFITELLIQKHRHIAAVKLQMRRHFSCIYFYPARV